MPFYSVNGIKIDPTVFFRRIFSPQNRSDRFWTAFAVTGQKFPSRSFRCLLRFQHCKFGNSAFFSGRARRGPQTIWRTHGGIVIITGSGQIIGIRRVIIIAGTQPGVWCGRQPQKRGIAAALSNLLSFYTNSNIFTGFQAENRGLYYLYSTALKKLMT